MIMIWRAFGCFVASSGMRAIFLRRKLSRTQGRPAGGVVAIKNTGRPPRSLLAFVGVANRHFSSVPLLRAVLVLSSSELGAAL